MKKRKKIIFLSVAGVVAAVALLIIGCYFAVVRNTSGKTYDNVEDIPHNNVGLLLATSPITPDGEHNYSFDNRIKAAEDLYYAEKVDFIIASGGDYTRIHKYGCDEPKAIYDSLVARGIDPERIILDYEGTRTLNSIAKARKVYGLESMTVISQKYHNERAIYLADKYHIRAIGYNAKPSPIRRNRIKNTLRELLARPKMFLDILTGTKPAIKEDSIHIPSSIYELYFDEFCLPRYLNSVKGHKEERMIVGNFTGAGIDTLRVVEEEIDSIDNMYERYKFYAKSNNPEIPTIELFGCGYATPLLVYEGDVDGDGKDEWGYLHTWLNSQWRQYRIYNYDSKRKEWRFLYYDTGDESALLHTSESLRACGVDIVEKGPEPGFIKINFVSHDEEWDWEVRDTIVRPTYTRISKDAW